MPEDYNIVLITGALTLLGTLLGGLMTFIIDVFRRRWLVTDRQYDRKKEVLDRRCDQAESYAQAATKDFRDIMQLSKTFLLEPEHHIVKEQDQKRKKAVSENDNLIFSFGSSISALGDEELRKQWDLMMDSFDALATEYQKLYQFRFVRNIEIDQIKSLANIEEIWLQYSEALGKFYKRIDEIRNKL